MHESFINKQLKNSITHFRTLPHRYYVIGAFVFAAIMIAIILWPRQVTFSYATNTCFYQPTVAPDLLRSHGDGFRLEAAQKLTIGGVAVAALKACVVPVQAPQRGHKAADVSLLGIPWLRKAYDITVPKTPVASVAALGQRPLSVAKDIMIPLSAHDTIFTYKIRVADATADCDHKEMTLVCRSAQLSLKQGTDYTLMLDRYFKSKRIATVATQSIKTLTATTVTAASITNGQIVYVKPKTIELTTDKPLVSGAITLERIEEGKRTTVPVTVELKENKAIVGWTDELVRQARFELTVSKLTGNDGSGLDGVYKTQFETSGGPKVKSVNIGTYKVPLGAQATITFDQPIAPSQDMTNIITASGGAVITGKRGAQVFVDFAGVPRCGDVVLTVKDTLQSEYGVTGGSAWRYATRTICQVVSSIGSSIKGRPLTTYSFGGGPETVLYTGAIHGNESSTRALMLRWIDELEAKPGSIPAGVRVVVIPVVNPDGYASGTRTNARNVDLNRNFATADWKTDITTVTNAPFPGGGGESALSEPESKALAGYVASVRPRLVLSYHSIGGLLAANQTGSSAARASTYARLSGYANTTGASNTFEYGISGTADDYYGQVLGVPSILIELGSHSDPQFAQNRDALWAMLK